MDETFGKVQQLIDKAETHKWVSTELANILRPTEAKGGRLYLTPKVHKPDSYYENSNGILFPPCRTIVSCSGSSTERISWFVDEIGQRYVVELPSWVNKTGVQTKQKSVKK